MHPKFKFQNGGRIWKCSFKQSCRTFDFEQLLFLEIFELLWKFESNLWILANGKLVNFVNSVHRRSYMAGDRLRRSRRARGGLAFALAWERRCRGFSLLPWPPYKAPTPSSSFFLRPLFFPTLPIFSGELSSSNQCLCRCIKASFSSTLSLRA